MSDIEPLVSVVSKLYAFSGENPLVSILNVCCCYDLDRGKTDLVGVC